MVAFPGVVMEAWTPVLMAESHRAIQTLMVQSETVAP
jgi:hypothetical protein